MSAKAIRRRQPKPGHEFQFTQRLRRILYSSNPSPPTPHAKTPIEQPNEGAYEVLPRYAPHLPKPPERKTSNLELIRRSKTTGPPAHHPNHSPIPPHNPLHSVAATSATRAANRVSQALIPRPPQLDPCSLDPRIKVGYRARSG
ncbi:hypothetical protein AOQ84DRAFT_440902 [Glonium stellatum]|uniref:Uncharacterized protein n=1 Tax=Glonium stellatum TaxID=574774 RepID=A0A8E2EXB2_9PEZI|nr:hypothetical protein AOQ84DRAFT_440902 [Glonium stellatum]